MTRPILTAKQQRFTEEYLLDLNATQAAIRAGYKEKAAAATASENLRKPYIRAEIQRGIAKRSEQTGIDAQWVLLAAKQLFDKAWEDGDTQSCFKALAIIGKHVDVQAFTPKSSGTDGGNPVQVVISHAVAGIL